MGRGELWQVIYFNKVSHGILEGKLGTFGPDGVGVAGEAKPGRIISLGEQRSTFPSLASSQLQVAFFRG